MDDHAQILLKMYEEDRAHARYHGNLRERTTQIMLVLYGGALAFMSRDDALLDPRHLVPAIVLVTIGLFGTFFTAKHHQLFAKYDRRSEAHLEALETCVPATALRALQTAADGDTSKKYRWLYPIQVHWFWESLHLLMFLAGVLLTAAILLRC